MDKIQITNDSSIFEEILFKYNLSRTEIPTLYKIRDILKINSEEKEFINHLCFCVNVQFSSHYVYD